MASSDRLSWVDVQGVAGPIIAVENWLSGPQEPDHPSRWTLLQLLATAGRSRRPTTEVLRRLRRCFDRVTIDGDDVLAAQVLAAMGFTP
jgi:hypothetical protein